MNLIVVFSCTQYGEELLKRAPAFGPSGLVWSQVARIKVQQLSLAAEWTEVAAAAQIGGWIDNFGPGVWTMRRRQEIGVPRPNVLGLWTLAMTPVAVHLCIDNVAAQSNQSSIPSIEMEGNGCDCKAYLDLALILVVIGFRPRADGGSLERQ